MTINLHLPAKSEVLRPTITVVGVGGAGGNAVNNMIASNLEGVNFVVANTDAQALDHSLTERTIQLGAGITKGLGAGANPEVGRAAAEEAKDEISAYIEGSNMVFITAGMGGGTGTGSASVVARIAKEQGILTVAVVTKPFQFEGTHRMRLAESGLKELQEYVDTLIIIPNQNLFRIANERTTFADAFKMADEVLHSGVRGVTDLMVKPGLINLDFADIRTVMREMGKAMMGTGEATGERRAVEAAEAAISNPLLDDVSLKGARALLINITGGPDMTLFEVDEAANRVREEVDSEANIIFGSAFNESMEGTMRVSVVATGIDAPAVQKPVESQKVAAPIPTTNVNTGADMKKPYAFVSAPANAAKAEAPKQPVAIGQQQQQQPQRTPAYEPARDPNPNTANSASVRAMVERANNAMRIDNQAEQGIETGMPAQQEKQVPVARFSDFDDDYEVSSEQGLVHEGVADAAQARVPQRDPASAATPQEAFTPAARRDSYIAVSPAEQSGRREAQREAAGSNRSFFQRMADVGRVLSRNDDENEQPAERIQVVQKSLQVEVSEKPARLSDEDQYLDIPAFLRRQAN
jgi:cell division protein FtsZ